MRHVTVIPGGVAAAAIAPVPIVHPLVHAVATGLGLTAASLLYVRRTASSPAPAHGPP